MSQPTPVDPLILRGQVALILGSCGAYSQRAESRAAEFLVNELIRRNGTCPAQGALQSLSTQVHRLLTG